MASSQHTYLLSMGSNLGDREDNLYKAIFFLEQFAEEPILVSPFFEYDSWGYDSGNKYINACCKIRTKLKPLDLLKWIHNYEESEGRVKTIGGKYKDRAIDIDILIKDQLMVKNKSLTIPHPQMQNRKFVLEPLNEIAPEFRHPILRKTMHELFIELNEPQ